MRKDGRGKYGLIKNRRLAVIQAWSGGDGEILDQRAVEEAIALLERAGVIDWGTTPDTEFFVIRLRDRFAGGALHEYAHAARLTGEREYAGEVEILAARAGIKHPNCKKPD
jgi:hypothetical protein